MGRGVFKFSRSMNNQQLHRTNSYIRARNERTVYDSVADHSFRFV